MGDPQRELEHLGKLALADPAKRFDKLYNTETGRSWRAGCSEELPAQF